MELLIVIVIIATLAAIVIIAYASVTSRATVASLSTTLETSRKTLKLYQFDNGGFPVGLDCSVSPAPSTICLKSSGSTTYHYSYDNSASPQAFCVTATSGTTSYYIDQNINPTHGACSGQVAGGSITNLATNPSLESNLTSGAYWAGNGGTASLTNPSTAGYSGTRFGRLTWTTGTTSVSGGPSFRVPATAGTTYAASFWVRSSKAQSVSMQLKFLNGGTTLTSQNGSVVSLSAGVWTNVSYTATAPATTTSMKPGIYASAGSGTNSLAGDYIDCDAAIVTTGSTLYNFADGSSPGWTWSGTVNNSSSTGPPL